MGKKYTVYAFDFDGTLTTKDTFFAFLGYTVGYPRLVCYCFLLLPDIVALLFRRASLQATKEKLFTKCFRGMPLEVFDKKCQDFVQTNGTLLRKDGMDCIKDLSRENPVLIVSASIRNYIAAFFQAYTVIIEATVPEVDEAGLLTGKFTGANCKGAEKVRRIESHFPRRQEYRLVAFGDSAGDAQMFAFADETHWKPFRRSKPAGLTPPAS